MASIFTLTDYDVENIVSYKRAYPVHSLRDAVYHWISLNANDYSEITDFMAMIVMPLTEKEVLFDWRSVDAQEVYNHHMFDDA
jgi:hypothetical protein